MKNKWIWLPVALMIAACLYGMQGVFGFLVFPDEFGYWAPAAYVAGFDWTKTVALGPYYSYGYSLLLTPVLLAFTDSITAYRAALFVNLALQIGGFLCLTKIAKELAPEMADAGRTFLCGVAALYPAWTLYTQTTMAEGLVFFLYTFLAWQALNFFKKATVVRGCAIALTGAYLYTAHMRTVGVVAVAAVLAIVQIREKDAPRRRGGIALLVTLVVLMALATYLKSRVTETVFADVAPKLLSVNDYAGQLQKAPTLFSGRGIGLFFLSMAGKSLYLGSASFGVAYVGAYALAKRAKESRFCLFLLLSAVAQFLVTTYDLLGSADAANERLDLFLNGRYNDYLLPVLMLAGSGALYRSEKAFRTTAIASACMAGLCAVCSWVVHRSDNGMNDPHPAMMAGMGLFVRNGEAMPVGALLLTVAIAIALGFAATFLLTVCRKRRDAAPLALLLLAQTAIALIVCSRVIYTPQSYIYGDLQMADQIRELQHTRQGRVVHLFEGGNAYVDNVQMRLREEPVYVIPTGEAIPEQDASGMTLPALNAEDYVLVDFQSEWNAELEAVYDHRIEAGHFDLYYNGN